MPTGDGSAARAGSIIRRQLALGIVAELDMTDFVRHEEGPLEQRANILMKDQIVSGDEGRPAAVEDSCAGGGWLDIDPPPLGLCDRKVIRRPGIGARGDEANMKLGGDLPGELHAVHVSPPPPTTGHASRPGRPRRSAPARR